MRGFHRPRMALPPRAERQIEGGARRLWLQNAARKRKRPVGVPAAVGMGVMEVQIRGQHSEHRGPVKFRSCRFF